MENPVLPSSCVTPAGTSIEVQNEWEENTHTLSLSTLDYSKETAVNVDVPLIFFCPPDQVPDWQPRIILGNMVEARLVNVKKTENNNNSNTVQLLVYVVVLYSETPYYLQ